MHPVIMSDPVRFTLIGGATALIEFSGIRFLTDPTFDRAGAEFRSGSYVLERISDPAARPETVLPVDAVLLSHDHHFDNLDASGASSWRVRIVCLLRTPAPNVLLEMQLDLRRGSHIRSPLLWAHRLPLRPLRQGTGRLAATAVL